MKLPDPGRSQQYFADYLEFTSDPVAVAKLIDSGRIVLVDVRAAEDFAKEHVPGSINLPRDRWDSPTGLSRDKPNIVFCYNQTCHLAGKACYTFAAAGWPVKLMEGGFKVWKDLHLPIVTGLASAA
jgi:rhodanese-related sulfurtransferase